MWVGFQPAGLREIPYTGGLEAYPTGYPMKRPRFTLRDLFWLVLVAAMGCAWWANHHSFKELQRLREEAIAAKERAAILVRKAEGKGQYRELKLSEWERALQDKEDDLEMYRRAYFYYRERLPPPQDDDET